MTDAGGFLVDGCPEDFVNRNQYDQLDSCKGLSGSLDTLRNITDYYFILDLQKAMCLTQK